MIYARSKKLLFIKTKKTAGTSLELVLRQFCSPEDIITTITPEDEQLHFGGLRPRNYSKSKTLELTYNALLCIKKYGLASFLRNYGKKHVIFKNHISASKVKELIGTFEFNSAYKFAVERHPYEKVVSRAWHRMRNQKTYHDMAISDAIDMTIASGSGFINWPIYSDGVNVLVDKVLSYENLFDELKALEDKFGMGGLASRLPNAKSRARKNKTNAFELLTDKQKIKVHELCSFEFKLMNYDV